MQTLIDRTFYDAIVNFDRSEAARDYYYKVMDTRVERNGQRETVRAQILRAYAMLFCEDIRPGELAYPEAVRATADRLYTGGVGFDRKHWYRMRYHYPVIDEDNYDRFAALVIADLKAGELRDAALNGGDMLLVGDPDPLHMTREQRARQSLRPVTLGGEGQ